jgi:hypothetical protein
MTLLYAISLLYLSILEVIKQQFTRGTTERKYITAIMAIAGFPEASFSYSSTAP